MEGLQEYAQAVQPVGPHAAMVAPGGNIVGLQTKRMKAKGVAPGSGFDTQKSNLNGSCMRILKRNLLKGEITYDTKKVVGGFQSEVTVFCLQEFWGAKTFVGTVLDDPRKAEHSAAQVALDRILAEPSLQMEHETPGKNYNNNSMRDHPSDKRKKAHKEMNDDGSAVWDGSQGGGFVPDGYGGHPNNKKSLNEICMKLVRRALKKGDVWYETTQVVGGYQCEVALNCLAEIWGIRTFVGEVAITENSAQQSAASIAQAAIVADPAMVALMEAAREDRIDLPPVPEKMSWIERQQMKDKGNGKGQKDKWGNTEKYHWDHPDWDVGDLSNWGGFGKKEGGKGKGGDGWKQQYPIGKNNWQQAPADPFVKVPVVVAPPGGSSAPASAKERLFAACCTITENVVEEGTDIVYDTQKAIGSRFQSTVTMPCLPGELGTFPFAGAIKKEKQDAEESAAQVALDSLNEDDEAGPKLKAAEGAGLAIGRQEEPPAKRRKGPNDNDTKKMALNGTCMKILRRNLQKGDIVYTTTSTLDGQWQSVVTASCLPDEWASMPFGGEILPTEREAEQSAAGVAMEAILADPVLSAKYNGQ